MNITPRLLRLLLNLYGPYLGAGIRVTHISHDWRELRVTLKLHWYNRNAVGTHFGGSLYSMVDPHFMLLLMKRLGKSYIVWDKSAEIDFLRPVKGPVHAVFRIEKQDEDRIREQTQNGEKYLPEFEVLIKGEDEQTVAVVKKQLYVRLKKGAPEVSKAP